MIIGISGRARSGKDTVARFLVWNHCFEKIAIAEPMKRFCKDIFGFTPDQLEGKEKELPDPRYNGLTPRRALQLLGTEYGRACYEDLWISYAIRKAKEILASSANVGVCISDVRFKNEYDAVKAAGGQMWRIVRPNAGLSGITATHPSETELTDDMPYDRVLNNEDGSLEDLAKMVRNIIEGRS